MSRINDLPGPIAAQSGDTVVGTDSTDSNKTVKFTVDSIAALATGSSVALLDDIGNVDTASKSDGQVLTWNGVSWVATTVSGGGGATALPELTDVATDATSSASPGDVLAWDTSSGGEWQSQATSLVVAPATLNNLDDVNLTTPADGSFLKFTGVSWQNTSLVISDIDDVDVSGASTGDTLVLTAGGWTATALELDNLGDVNLTVEADGNFLKYNGSFWQNSLPVISDIDDVDVSGASTGDILVLTAGEWAATTPVLSTLDNVASAADAPGVGHLLYNNGTEWIAVDNTVTVTLSPAAGLTVENAIASGVGIESIAAPTADMLIGDAFVVPTELNEWSITRVSVAAFHPEDSETYDVQLARAASGGVPALIGSSLTVPTATANTYAAISASANIEVTDGDVISLSVLRSPAPVSADAKQLTATIEFTQNP